MASARKLKTFRNKTWFRNRRGGVKLTPSKDLPWYAQSREEIARNDETGNKVEREREREKEDGESRMIKNIETVVFVPSTPGSQLKKSLQEADNVICQTVNSPSVRFVETGGPTIMELVGNNNPGAREWWCPRHDCAPCQGRRVLGQEEIEDTLKRSDGEEVPKKSLQDRTALPSCVGEGINYVIECQTCRRNGIRRQYKISLEEDKIWESKEELVCF